MGASDLELRGAKCGSYSGARPRPAVSDQAEGGLARRRRLPAYSISLQGQQRVCWCGAHPSSVPYGAECQCCNGAQPPPAFADHARLWPTPSCCAAQPPATAAPPPAAAIARAAARCHAVAAPPPLLQWPRCLLVSRQQVERNPLPLALAPAVTRRVFEAHCTGPVQLESTARTGPGCRV